MGQSVAIIGAGVIGLTSAICLQDAGFQVTILTKEMPQNTTSGQPEPSGGVTGQAKSANGQNSR